MIPWQDFTNPRCTGFLGTSLSNEKSEARISNAPAYLNTISSFEHSEIIARSLDGLSIESGDDLREVLKVSMFTSLESEMQRLEEIVNGKRIYMTYIIFNIQQCNIPDFNIDML
ncbi:hypothetical protein L1987_81340 [Smallanthus sonchifolius]|uniref:Uncharacterized protein n=1 Tax=Smallanthus sonchifolius TaxID=185202 RepID=A0ACB8YUE7_9ASTR|nr:hypothetical protein L1987_81340 [Smallanthus sonchifolius]